MLGLSFMKLKESLGKVKQMPELVVLPVLIIMYLFLANIYAMPATFNGSYFPTSGGSDPFYNFRSIVYTLHYHRWLTFDSALNYPVGSVNPRTPFFHFFIIMVAFMLSPFMNIITAAKLTLLEFDAVFGALLIVPVYLITKELFGKRAGMVAALLYALMPSNLSSGVLSDGRMHTPELIFAFLSIYFFQKSINSLSKERILGPFLNVKGHLPAVLSYLRKNRVGAIYAMLAGTSLGALALAWQGYAYIEAIIVIYIFVQLILNLFREKPSGYLLIVVILYFIFALTLPPYYYVNLGNASYWYMPQLYLGLVTIGFAVLVNIIGRKPWLISVSLLVVISLIGFVFIDVFYHSFITYLLSGSGYFVKSRVYRTIAEAASPPLGEYVSGFGAFQFILGLSGIAYIVYRYLKSKNESMLFIFIFSIISIYMSFAAARFNVTAAPAYAALGAGFLIFLADTVRLSDLKKRKVSIQMGIRKSIKGNIKGLHAAFVIILVLTLTIPAGSAMVNAAVPANNAGQINNQIYYSLPSFMRPVNYSQNAGQFVGTYGFYVTNDSQPLSQSLLWLGNQDRNVPLDQRPAYVSWWDYGFQELVQGKHPTVADDFQQGYEVAGQVLLAQNQSMIISLFLARDIQGSYEHNKSLTPKVFNALSYWFGYREAKNISNFVKDPLKYAYLIQEHPSIYGKYIPDISRLNAYFALVSGQLSHYYNTSTLVNAYQNIIRITGFNIKYIGLTTYGASLLPFSGNNTGIFYAPAYLTDHPSYNYEGEIVPYQYYNIFAVTQNGTYPLSQLPPGKIPVGYKIQYKPAFYNTSIYRFIFGYPPYAVGQKQGLPGINYGQNNMSLEPAWNMSHFIVEYFPIFYNPYHNARAHPHSWKVISLQQAYQYRLEKKGTVLIFPPPDQVMGFASPIVAYYPGAEISGRIVTKSGIPTQGIYVTIFDQYGVPHEYTKTNKNGYYHLVGLPGNDTVIISTGKFTKFFLTGKSVIGSFKVNITKDQANRIPTSYNATTGLPDYYIVHNYVLNNTEVSGNVHFQYEFLREVHKGQVGFFMKPIESGKIIYSNSTYGYSVTANITGGDYQIKNLPPYNYSVSVVTGGKVYKNLMHALVRVGSSTVYNVYVTYDVIYAKVMRNGLPLEGYNVSAVSPSYSTWNLTNSSGRAILWVYPGNYSVTASVLNSTSYEQNVSFSSWGLNTTANLTPEVSVRIYGRISGAVSPLTIKFFAGGSAANITKTIKVEGTEYSTVIPEGLYTVYASSGDGVFMKTVFLDQGTSLNITLTQGYNVTVHSKVEGLTSYSQVFEITSNSAILRTGLLTSHNYSIVLTRGQYYFSAYASSVGNIYFGFNGRYVASNTSLTVSMQINPSNISVRSFDASISSVYNSQSELSGPVSILYYSNYPVYFSPSIRGVSLLYYQGLDRSLFSIKVYYPGYSPMLIKSVETAVSAGLHPVMVNVTFKASPELAGGIVKFTGAHTYTGQINLGIAHFKVQSGIYRISVQSGNMYVNMSRPVVSVPSVKSITFTPVYTPVVSIKVPDAKLQLYNARGEEVNPSMLIPGNYTMYAVKGSLVNISYAYVNHNTTLSPVFSQGYSITLENNLSLFGGYYNVISGRMIINVTSAHLVLPAGDYTVTYHNTITGSKGDFKIFGSVEVSITQATIIRVNVIKLNVSSVIRGSINAPAGSEVTLFTPGGVVVNSTLVNAYGGYSIGAPEGNYVLYAKSVSGGKAYLTTKKVSAFRNYSYNITMMNASLVYVNTALNGKLIYTNVTLLSGNLSFTFNSSRRSLILPDGSYEFTAKRSVSFDNYSGAKILVNYSSSVQVLLAGKTTYVNLNLQKVSIYSFNVTLKSTVRDVYPGSTVDYNFSLRNTGNSNVTVNLDSGNYTWKMNFTNSIFHLMPGQTVNDSVTITLPENIPAGYKEAPIAVHYGIKGKFMGYLKVKVKPVYNLSLNLESSVAIANGTLFEVPVNITNTGNAAIRLNLSLNSTGVYYYGWNASLVLNASPVNHVYVQYHSYVIVYVLFTPSNVTNRHVAGGSVILNVSGPSNISKSISIHAIYPSSPQVSPYPSGVGIISNYTGNPYGNLIIGVILIVVSVLVGLIVSGSRSKKRGGR